ncbi:DUF3558 domain-containing protein [Streptomyces tropicalis]|uniref:DUF3558 domain-containing protein n=1 Tax=Streptomyces tropicalis TaxID=3034234 RepID=A0ABT6AB25_9ACTN|nr:DUF3558 domain-containing protein [Streptomyces tropicalis]MDF3301853.1 DUF3558 domain-containing protein [Streptomyces tropicalis]
MLRKAYVPGAAALLAALLAGCSGGSSGGGTTDSAKGGGTGTATAAAQPGKYRTLPEPCGVIGHGTLDALLPGIRRIADVDQRTRAYEGDAALTYDTDRKVGCRWKVDGPDATDHLSVDFERVVSYDNSVSDDSQAHSVFAAKQTAADLPEPTGSGSASAASGSPAPSGSTSSPAAPPAASSSSAPSSASSAPTAPSSGSAGSSASSSGDATPSDLQPRTLDDLGDEAFLDDALNSTGSTVEQRTVTVAFRTSNVVVTIVYEEQPATLGAVPDSKEMQDKARKLAAQLADSLGG